MNCKFGNIGLLSKVTISLSLTWMLMGGKSRKCWKVREIHELICFLRDICRWNMAAFIHMKLTFSFSIDILLMLTDSIIS